MPPEPAGVGKAVQQHDRPPLTGDLVLDTDPVDIHPCHLASLCNAETSARSCSRVGLNGCAARQPDPSWRVLSRSPGRANTSSGVRSTNLMSKLARVHSGSRPNAA